MKFIDKCKKLAKKGKDKKFEECYLEACQKIRNNAIYGKYHSYYRSDDVMKSEIYEYVKQRLEKEGFDVVYEDWIGGKRLKISWEE